MPASDPPDAIDDPLTITEELVLLLLDDRAAFLPIPEHTLESVLTGAVLMDLAFAGRIDTDLESLIVTDRAPTGNPLLDRVLAAIAERSDVTDARHWVGLLSDDTAGIGDHALGSLAVRGILATRSRRSPWTPRFVFRDRTARREIHQRIGHTILTDDIPDPRDIALISLADACNILPDIFPRREFAARDHRVAQLRRMDLIGREVAGRIVDLEREILRALQARLARFRTALLALSAAGVLAVLATLLSPPVPIPDRFGPSYPQVLWLEGAWQEWTGYLLLVLTGAGLLANALKRMRRLARGSRHARWRVAHTLLGLACVAVLFAHTGFRFGANLNAVLMSCYVAALVLGAVAGIGINGTQHLRRVGIAPRRWLQWPTRLHVAALFPLPALLAVHILVVYLY